MKSDHGRGGMLAANTAANTAAFTTIAMIAFAANSLLCRAALGPRLIDAASFSTLRVVSAAVVLALVTAIQRRRLPARDSFDWRTSLMLFGYIAFFSFGYERLSTGTGALILFACVQLTMFATALARGERFNVLAWGGLVLAFAGLVWLVLPGLSAPDPLGAGFMAIAGMSWGIFSLRGRGAKHPVESNAASFIACIPLVLLVSAGSLASGHATLETSGLLLALASGGIASGFGYILWYAALRDLTAGRAASVQICVPALAALAGVIFLDESLTLRLVAASIAMLGGMALVVFQRSRVAG